ncbi:MAG: hypothetical protein ACE3L7_04120 [Candidatus Pristimantibacillus sp.]
MLILKQPLNYGGGLFKVGEDVRGKLPLDLLEKLQEEGHIEEVEGGEVEAEEPTSENDPKKEGSTRGRRPGNEKL